MVLYEYNTQVILLVIFKFVTYNSIHLFMVYVHILCMQRAVLSEEYLLHWCIYTYIIRIEATTPRCGMEISFGVVYSYIAGRFPNVTSFRKPSDFLMHAPKPPDGRKADCHWTERTSKFR